MMARDPLILQEVKAVLAQVSALAPGNSVELRIPPYAAIQCVAGPKHTRGTPANVVEMAADSLFGLCAGTLEWSVAVGDGRISASGERSDLSGLFLQLAGFFDQSGWKHRIAE
jgi:Bacterial SCP ortholog